MTVPARVALLVGGPFDGRDAVLVGVPPNVDVALADGVDARYRARYDLARRTWSVDAAGRVLYDHVDHPADPGGTLCEPDGDELPAALEDPGDVVDPPDA